MAGTPTAAFATTHGSEPMGQKAAMGVSVGVHAVGLVALAIFALLEPHRASVVPVFELVSLEKPKLRPLQPKVQPPPEPPPPEPEPVAPPEAPKLTPKTNAVNTKKPEPKVVKEREPEAKVKEVVREQQVLVPVVMNIPSDPRLSFWASRVKKKVDMLWQPPAGMDIAGVAQTVVNFKVNRDGTIVDQQIAESSGNAELDEMAIMAIKRVGPVPPIPENFPNDELEVRCELKYQGH